MRARGRSRSLSGYRLRSCAILGRSSRLGSDPVQHFPAGGIRSARIASGGKGSGRSKRQDKRTFSKLRSSLTPAWVLEISSRRRCLSFSMSPRRRSFSALRFMKSVRSDSSRFCFRAAKSTWRILSCQGVRACSNTVGDEVHLLTVMMLQAGGGCQPYNRTHTRHREKGRGPCSALSARPSWLRGCPSTLGRSPRVRRRPLLPAAWTGLAVRSGGHTRPSQSSLQVGRVSACVCPGEREMGDDVR